ncbi:hypothetical protein FA13DRAFT_1735333 [Coprinellus micaceus]|uniref:Uncharacterized protein n=1 Tax=Coprinellus micaceus TaxID=71717 RepID=A0A4Y7T5H0_COPMI|nr:hypothetical protein FA13DRAFT_1735333 [Coprinellus micaceus]
MRVEPPPRAVATRALSRSGSVIKTSNEATSPSLSPSPIPSSPPTLSPEKMGSSAEEEENPSASATRGKRAASPLPSALWQEGPVVKKRKLDSSRTLPDMLPDPSSSKPSGHRQPTRHEERPEMSGRHQHYSKEKIESEHRRIVEGARMARAIPGKFTPQFYAFHLNMLKKYGVPPDYKPLDPPPGWTGDFVLPATQTQHRSSTPAPTLTLPPRTAHMAVTQVPLQGVGRTMFEEGRSPSQPGPLVGHKTQLIESFEPVEEEADRKMDWERSRQLAETFRSEIRLGKRPTLPKLLCTSMGESQSQTQSESQHE